MNNAVCHKFFLILNSVIDKLKPIDANEWIASATIH